MSVTPFTELRDNLREIVDEVVTTGEHCTITRHGKPLAVVLGFDEYEALIESLNILSDEAAMGGIAEGEAEFAQEGK